MNKMNIVFKIILPLFAGLFLIASVSIYTNFFFLEKNIVKKTDETFASVSKVFKSIIKQDTKVMIHLIEQTEEDPIAMKLYKAEQREKLFEHFQKKMEIYQQRYDITHFYIHHLDKTNFLRVHNKQKHSDFINRTTLQDASTSFLPSSGVEFGISHNLTLRVVSPWFVDNQLIGYIELGKEIDKITPELKSLIDVDFIFTISKDLVSNDDIEQWENSNIKYYHYSDMKNYYIIDSSIINIGKTLKNYLDETKKETKSYLENNRLKYFINTQPLYDVTKKQVGYIHTLKDVTEDYAFLFSLVLKVSFVVCVLLFLMVMYYIRYLEKQEAKLKEAYAKIEELSITDGLTSLYNKRYCLENAPSQISISSRHNKYISFILLDIDYFKKYNDRYGHLKGDNALVEVSKVIKKLFKRSTDCSYRVGGEEFLIISSSTYKENNTQMAETLRKAIEDLNIEHLENDKYKKLTVSIGVCSIKAGDCKAEFEVLYNNADKALYRSKKEGRNKVTLVDCPQ